MAQRLELQVLLEGLVPEGWEVYFQPPTNLKLSFPCIVFNRDHIHIRHADNVPFKHTKRYQITVIDPDPDSEIPDKVAQLPTVSFDRAFTADNLHHDVFTLFF
jgi:hypothetical protein